MNDRPPEKLTVHNEGAKAVEVFIEPTPSRYVLMPNDELVIAAEASGMGYSISIRDGSLAIYPAIDSDPAILLNGEAVESDWTTTIPGD